MQGLHVRSELDYRFDLRMLTGLCPTLLKRSPRLFRLLE